MAAPTLFDAKPVNMSWQLDAMCSSADVDPEIFHSPTSYGEGGALHEQSKQRVRQAKAVCKTCPVRSECLIFAYETDDRFGILGGMTPRERTNYYKKQAGRPRPRSRGWKQVA